MGGIELELMAERYRWRFAGGFGFTEDAADIMRDARRWGVRRERLGFADPRAHRLGARRMVDLELIWLLGILSVTEAHPYYASAAFAFALTDADGSGMAGGDLVLDNMPRTKGDGAYCLTLAWGELEGLAREAGVDYQVESYLSGAALEHILGDPNVQTDRMPLFTRVT